MTGVMPVIFVLPMLSFLVLFSVHTTTPLYAIVTPSQVEESKTYLLDLSATVEMTDCFTMSHKRKGPLIDQGAFSNKVLEY